MLRRAGRVDGGQLSTSLSQFSHVVARASEYVPGPQGEQLTSSLALDFPAGQSKQLDAPSFEVRPGSHVMQVAEPEPEK